MVQPIRAVYQDGQLRLLDPIDLVDGQEIRLTILSDREQVRSAWGDLLVETAALVDSPVDEPALMRAIAEDFQGQPPLSDTIIEERHEGS